MRFALLGVREVLDETNMTSLIVTVTYSLKKAFGDCCSEDLGSWDPESAHFVFLTEDLPVTIEHDQEINIFK